MISIALLQVLVLATAAVMCSTGVATSLVPALFAFGDSLTDTGTNNYIDTSTRANFPPYGETYFRHPTGRFCDGRLLVDFLAELLGLPLLHPFVQPGANLTSGVNFASAGSGLLDCTNQEAHIVSNDQQISQFEQAATELEAQLGKESAHLLLNRSMYFITSGSNDVANYYENIDLSLFISVSDFVDRLLQSLTKTITAIYERGGRKIVVANLQPVGCIPNALDQENSNNCVARVNHMCMTFNERLQQAQAGLTNSLPGIMVVVANYYDAITSFLSNGTAYGFTEASQSCCGGGRLRAAILCGASLNGKALYTLCPNVSNYVYWDMNHLTERSNSLLAHLFWEGDQSVISPINIQALAAASLSDSTFHQQPKAFTNPNNYEGGPHICINKNLY